jgi:hypothetical protein
MRCTLCGQTRPAGEKEGIEGRVQHERRVRVQGGRQGTGQERLEGRVVVGAGRLSGQEA